MDEVEHVEIGEWISGWLAVGSMDGSAGYVRLSAGVVGEIIASFTLMLPEGGMSSDYVPVTERFLRYDPARNSVDYLAYVDEYGWSLEHTTQVSGDIAIEIGDSWPAITFQYLVNANQDLDVYPLSLEQAQEMGWAPCFDDPNPPPFDHLWRPVVLSEP